MLPAGTQHLEVLASSLSEPHSLLGLTWLSELCTESFLLMQVAILHVIQSCFSAGFKGRPGSRRASRRWQVLSLCSFPLSSQIEVAPTDSATFQAIVASPPLGSPPGLPSWLTRERSDSHTPRGGTQTHGQVCPQLSHSKAFFSPHPKWPYLVSEAKISLFAFALRKKCLLKLSELLLLVTLISL